MEKVNLLNIAIDNIYHKDLLNSLKKGVIFTPNVDHLMKLQQDKIFYDAYLSADYILADSQILMFASKFLKTPIVEKISGSDFLPLFYDYHKNNPDIKIFLLGAKPGIAEKAAKIINKKIDRKIIVGYHSPSFGFEKDENECDDIVDIINESSANVLIVGVGAPKQEKWIAKYKNRCKNIDIFMGLGATIDFESRDVKRAPKFMSNMGLEWLFRLATEPRRLWKRYLIDNTPFFYLLLKQKLGYYKNPL